MASRVRRAGGNLFWELFAGVAILSRTFEEEGWRTGPAIDIVYTKAFNLLDPGFFMVVLGLILEGWVSVLHLGPPSSSFSMAFNRRASKRIRADERPAGWDNLSEVGVQHDAVLGRRAVRDGTWLPKVGGPSGHQKP